MRTILIVTDKKVVDDKKNFDVKCLFYSLDSGKDDLKYFFCCFQLFSIIYSSFKKTRKVAFFGNALNLTHCQLKKSII